MVGEDVQQAKEAFGARLRELRKEASLTGRALTQVTGLHYTKVSRVENGYPAPRSQNILKNSFGAFRSVAAGTATATSWPSQSAAVTAICSQQIVVSRE